MSNTFYITTAIDYPNGSPHLGHAYEKIVSDAYARWYRLRDFDVHFLTGTDENGQKLVESAKAKNMDTQEFVDAQVKEFRKLCSDLNISNDDFIRTTEPRHVDVAQQFWNKLEKKGDIYFGRYSGDYCLQCENFYTQSQAPEGMCPEHHTPLKKKEEDGYFFKMSNYSEWIIQYIKDHPGFILPRARHNEIINRLEKEPLRDLAISRPNTENWGIPVPGNEKFIMYTWFDALINYYSALGTKTENFWPADMHVIGKDIIWFHSVIWPIMLKALDIELPKQVYVHGMILAEGGRKMSKSMGNVISPQDMMAKYPVDSFRYYLLRAISSMQDGSFSERELVDKHNNELGNDYGNLLMRVVKLSLKVLDGEVSGEGVEQDLNFSESHQKIKNSMADREHHRALESLWEQITKTNQYVNDSEPWKLKKEPEKFRPVVYNCLYSIHLNSLLLYPFMPETAVKALKAIGKEVTNPDKLVFGEEKYLLQVPEVLFPKLEL